MSAHCADRFPLGRFRPCLDTSEPPAVAGRRQSVPRRYAIGPGHSHYEILLFRRKAPLLSGDLSVSLSLNALLLNTTSCQETRDNSYNARPLHRSEESTSAKSEKNWQLERAGVGGEGH